MALLTGVAIGVLVTAQGPIVKSHGGSGWTTIAIGVLAALVGCLVMPRWSRFAARRPLHSLLWSSLLFMGAYALVVVPLAWLEDPLWTFCFIGVYATAMVAGAFGVVTGFNMTRHAHHLGGVVRANARFLSWRIPGVVGGRFVTPMAVVFGMDMHAGVGAEVLVASIGGTTLVVVIVLLARWIRHETQAADC